MEPAFLAVMVCSMVAIGASLFVVMQGVKKSSVEKENKEKKDPEG